MTEENIRRVNSSFTEEIQVLSLKGRITYDFIDGYKIELKGIIEDAGGYIIDLTKVEQIDSTGLGLLVNVAKNFIFNKNKMVILNKDDWINELFNVSKLNQVFNVCSTMEEALKTVTLEDDTYWNKVTSY